MGVPDFQSFFVPLLRVASDGREHTLGEARDAIARHFGLSTEDRAEKLPSGLQTRFDNRLQWAKTYFVQAGVLTSPKRGSFQIAARGRELAQQGHQRIDIRILDQYPEFVQFHRSNGRAVMPTPAGDHNSNVSETPEERLQEGYETIRADLGHELLEKVRNNTPEFFEKLVVDLMVSMGYGGSRADAAESIGQSGDEGVDGIIKEDRLGLDVIYLQAKRWHGPVGRPEIQKFVGALTGKRAKRGVFISAGTFTKEAIGYVSSIEPKVVLIDGDALVNYMIDFGIGTTIQATYEIRRVDSDYFIEK
jgi:restriction system protein